MGGFAFFARGDLGRSRRIAGVAQTLAIIIPAAEEQAILQPAVLGMRVQNDRYSFYRFLIDTEKHVGFWQPINDHLFGLKILPADVELIVEKTKPAEQETTGQANNAQPDIVLLPSGDITAFTITIGARGEAPSYQLIGQANGVISLLPWQGEE